MLVRSEQIILTVCVSHALVLALFCLFSPGARVALARPGYVAYRNTLKALHLEPVELACGEAERFQVTADAVEQLEPAPDGLIVASLANPTGRSEERRVGKEFVSKLRSRWSPDH